MINETGSTLIDSKSSYLVNSPTENSNFFSESIDSFQGLLKNIGLFSDDESTSSTNQSKTSDSQLTDVVEDVTSNIFGSFPGLSSGASMLNADEVSVLQRSLVDALKASLLSGSQQNTPTANQPAVSEDTSLIDNILSGPATEFFQSETVSTLSTFAGSYLIGGPMGVMFAAADAATKEYTGDSITSNLIDFGMSLFEDSAEQKSN